ncbi:MAG: AmmeMemoRadiSam system protein B [Bacteroidales bacterium]|nr:AmmeMemoRadiSam system protein B [Bacteroidales bacterium]
MKKGILFSVLTALAVLWIVEGCHQPKKIMKERTNLVDTVGFAQYPWQMDSLITRIKEYQGKQLDESMPKPGQEPALAVVAPHDDYTYVGYLYPATLSRIKAKTVILFGVAHKAAKLHLENQLIFDSYASWKGPWGQVKVSGMRQQIMDELPKGDFMVNDSMQSIEHSLEAEIPWLQYYNKDVQIVPVLVPAMSFDRMEQLAADLSKAIAKIASKKHLEWGKDFAVVISTDAVHYGDEGWGGSNYAFLGTGSDQYPLVKEQEHELMYMLSGQVSDANLHGFCKSTVMEDDFRKYKWTWCGRYSVPMGLLTVNKLHEMLYKTPIQGTIIGYSTSIERAPIPVNDLNMGITAPANPHHWVGYAALSYQ